MYLHYIPNDIHLQYKLTDPSYNHIMKTLSNRKGFSLYDSHWLGNQQIEMEPSGIEP